MAKENLEKNVISAYYGEKAFCKVKQNLEIGKVVFSFVDFSNPKDFIDCYMEAEYFGAILMAGIKNGALLKALAAEKAKGEQYPKAVWTSPIGGNAKGNNGKPISRYFEISPGGFSEVLFTARSYPAVESETGAFIKVKDSKPLKTIRVPLTYNDLKILAYKWGFLEADYMTKKYSLANMKSDFLPDAADANTWNEVPTEGVEEEAVPVQNNTAEAPVQPAPEQTEAQAENSFHHGNFRAKEIRRLEATDGYEVVVDDLTENDSKKLYFYLKVPKGYEKQAAAADQEKDNVATMDRFLKAAFSETNKGTVLQKPIPFKVMYQTIGSRNFFIKFS